MVNPVAVVDLFSGPGGLAEGFAPYHDLPSQRRYEIALSVENDPCAYRTLRLRAFLRKFPKGQPPEYYDYLNGETSESELDWAMRYPSEWKAAKDETIRLEIGRPTTRLPLERKLAKLHTKHGGQTVLIGGPPCQVHSIARARRNGIGNNSPYPVRARNRKQLYREFVNAIQYLKPAVAIMENVTGLLSSKFDGEPIFQDVLNSLRRPPCEYEYRLHALSLPSYWNYEETDLSHRHFIVKAEEYGIPQARHRVFIVCLRSDIADNLPYELRPKLTKKELQVNVDDVIGLMPKLRSGLSRRDTYTEWQKEILNSCEHIRRNPPPLNSTDLREFCSALSLVENSFNGHIKSLQRTEKGGTNLPDSCPSDLRNWLYDEHLTQLPNNETRGHMPSDLARYIFAASFAQALHRSPRTSDFPSALAPKHRSWSSGHFADRYRVQLKQQTCSTITSHISKDGHHFIHPDPSQCRSLTVREVARLQTFPDNYLFLGGRTQQYIQVGNAVPPFLARQIAESVWRVIRYHQDRVSSGKKRTSAKAVGPKQPLSKELRNGI